MALPAKAAALAAGAVALATAVTVTPTATSSGYPLLDNTVPFGYFALGRYNGTRETSWGILPGGSSGPSLGVCLRAGQTASQNVTLNYPASLRLEFGPIENTTAQSGLIFIHGDPALSYAVQDFPTLALPPEGGLVKLRLLTPAVGVPFTRCAWMQATPLLNEGYLVNIVWPGGTNVSYTAECEQSTYAPGGLLDKLCPGGWKETPCCVLQPGGARSDFPLAYTMVERYTRVELAEELLPDDVTPSPSRSRRPSPSRTPRSATHGSSPSRTASPSGSPPPLFETVLPFGRAAFGAYEGVQLRPWGSFLDTGKGLCLRNNGSIEQATSFSQTESLVLTFGAIEDGEDPTGSFVALGRNPVTEVVYRIPTAPLPPSGGLVQTIIPTDPDPTATLKCRVMRATPLPDGGYNITIIELGGKDWANFTCIPDYYSADGPVARTCGPNWTSAPCCVDDPTPGATSPAKYTLIRQFTRVGVPQPR